MSINEGVAVSILQVFEPFLDAEPVCPYCDGIDKVVAREGGRFGCGRCSDCRTLIKVRT